MKPFVTLGMCVRNSEGLLGPALNSITKQDYPHDQMEVIFVDDGSEDTTLQILKDYISRVDIKAQVFQTRWQGLGPARNLIAKNAQGKYILWVDADEILTKSYVRKQVEFMENNPNVGITTGIVQTIPGFLILNLELIPTIIDHTRYEQTASFLRKTERLPGTGGATFRVRALEQVKGFDERLKGVGEDQDVARRIKNAGWKITVNHAGFYERHGGMLTLKDLWRKYLWYGHGSRNLYRRNRKVFSLPRMSPVAGFAAGFLYSLAAYRTLRKKEVFLLPLHYGFKMTAWMIGFINSEIQSMRK